jgi:hypothetical protein
MLFFARRGEKQHTCKDKVHFEGMTEQCWRGVCGDAVQQPIARRRAACGAISSPICTPAPIHSCRLH